MIMKNKAMVIGKFMDFHIGHEALIKYAKTRAKEVIVLLCVNPLDRRHPEQRDRWIHYTFGNTIELVNFNYSAEAGLDGSETSDRVISKAWAEWVDCVYPEVDLLVGSEDYVTYMAEYGDFECDIFDMDRKNFPCSSTEVNAGAFEYRSAASKFELVRRVAFVGPESTGKSTAIRHFSEKLGYDFVNEAAKKMLGDDGMYSFYDLNQFALIHASDVNEAISECTSETLLIDSSVLDTTYYSLNMYDRSTSILEALTLAEHMDLYVVFSPEVPIVDDGTRLMTDEERNLMFNWMVEHLRKLGREFVIIKGTDYEDRLRQVGEVL